MKLDYDPCEACKGNRNKENGGCKLCEYADFDFAEQEENGEQDANPDDKS